MRDHHGNTDSQDTPEAEFPDDDVRKLMLVAGKRWELPAEARARVYAASLVTFEAMPEHAPVVQAPERNGRSWRFAVAASCLIALGAASFLFHQTFDPPAGTAPLVAKVIFGAGDPVADNRRLVPGDELAQSVELKTGVDARLQVQFSSGVEMRIDGNTRLQLTSISEVRLLSGRIYFDTANGGTVRVRTTMGDVTDIGTQFVVEYDQQHLDVIVREGAVKVGHGSNIEVARAQPGNGVKLRFSGQGISSRGPMSTTDPYWHWIGTASGNYQLGSGNLDDYLRKSAHECGLELRYSDSGSLHAAQTATVHGTAKISGCLETIDEILQTTRLQRVSPDAGYHLVIDFDKGD